MLAKFLNFSFILIILVNLFSYRLTLAITPIDLNDSDEDDIERLPFGEVGMDFSITTMPLRHKGLFKGKSLINCKLKGIDLLESGIEGASNLSFVDFTGSFNPPRNFVKGKNLRNSKLHGLNLTDIGIQDAGNVTGVDFTGSTQPPKNFAKGKKLTSAKLGKMDLFDIGLHEALDASNLQITGPVSIRSAAIFPGVESWSVAPPLQANDRVFEFQNHLLTLNEFIHLQKVFEKISKQLKFPSHLARIVDHYFFSQSMNPLALEQFLNIDDEGIKRILLSFDRLKSENLVLIVNPTNDHSGAFTLREQAFHNLFKQKNYEVFEIQTTDPKEVLKSVDVASHNVSHVVLRGHGNSTNLRFGKESHGKLDMENRFDQAATFFEELGRKMNIGGAEPTLLLHACDAGLKDSYDRCLGELASVMMGGVKVYAPNKEIVQGDLVVNQIGEKSVEYQTDQLNVYYNPITVTFENLQKKPKELHSIENNFKDDEIEKEVKTRLQALNVSPQTRLELESLFQELKKPNAAQNTSEQLDPEQKRKKEENEKRHKRQILDRLLVLFKHYEGISEVQAHCQVLVGICLGICDTGVISALEKEINSILKFDDIQDQILAKQNDFKDINILEYTLDRDLIKKLCEISHCPGLEWHLEHFKDGNQIHYLRAVQKTFGDELGYQAPNGFAKMEGHIIHDLFSHPEARKLFLEKFIKNHRNYLIDFYETTLNGWIAADLSKMTDAIGLIKSSKNTKNNFCSKIASNLGYFFKNEGIAGELTRGGVYCLLLASGLIGS